MEGEQEIIYPESDGQPLGENTVHVDYIIFIKNGLDDLFYHNPSVFVAADLFWYPVEGKTNIVTAPDVMVIFGRPKRKRGSYRQWEEENIPPQVVVEIRSPGNSDEEMSCKFNFYNRYGVEEYYIYDTQRKKLEGWLRQGINLMPITNMQGWVSPRLQIRFEPADDELLLFGPDGQRFITYTEFVSENVLQNNVPNRKEKLKSRLKRLKKSHGLNCVN